MALQVNYYFCLLSPWAYLGTARFETIAARHGAKVNYKPVKVRKVLDATGGVTLKKRSAQRRAYRMMELKRWRDHLEVPIVLEPRYEFPETDFIAARTVLAASREGGNPAGLVFGYLRAMWLEERDIADAATVRRIIAESGFDPDRLLEVAELPEIEETSPKPISTPATTASSVRREAIVVPSKISSKSCSSPRFMISPPGASLSRQSAFRPARAMSPSVPRMPNCSRWPAATSAAIQTTGPTRRFRSRCWCRW